MIFIFQSYSHKVADFATFTSEVGMKKNGRK